MQYIIMYLVCGDFRGPFSDNQGDTVDKHSSGLSFLKPLRNTLVTNRHIV